MAHWLYKSEPSSWSWEQQMACGETGTPWTGVRNHLAQKHMRAMQAGERGFFYHSNEGRQIVGIVEVAKTFYPDPDDESGRFGLVDLRAVRPLLAPVTLEAVKSQPELAAMVLIKNSRLSVQPVTDDEWAVVCRLGGL